jgi:serine/threonine protein kinase
MQLISDINLDPKEILVLKTINKKEMNRLKQLKNIEAEINIALNFENPIIRKIIFSFQDNKYIYIVERFCLGGNLKWHINLSLFEEQEAKYYIAELISALEYIHKKIFFVKIYHQKKL